MKNIAKVVMVSSLLLMGAGCRANVNTGVDVAPTNGDADLNGNIDAQGNGSTDTTSNDSEDLEALSAEATASLDQVSEGESDF